MRGKQSWTVTDDGQRRITPACAGKTAVKYFAGLHSQDHPRVCGENASASLRCSACGGSPPRVRGKLFFYVSPICYIRITPACAGKTVAYGKNQGSFKDHPRVCGENRFYKRRTNVVEGSPPRVRGKLFFYVSPICYIRITPACAGKTKRKLIM